MRVIRKIAGDPLPDRARLVGSTGQPPQDAEVKPRVDQRRIIGIQLDTALERGLRLIREPLQDRLAEEEVSECAFRRSLDDAAAQLLGLERRALTRVVEKHQVAKRCEGL